jgi:single-stranded-DNA-specific exonuclease
LALETAGPWGQGFPEPRFDGVFEIDDYRPVGADGRHVKYRLRTPAGQRLDAVHFNGAETALEGGRARAVYALCVNRFRGNETLELKLDSIEPA